MKLNYPSFVIKIASKPKRISKSIGSKISRKCLAVVKTINGKFQAVINIEKHHIQLNEGDELSNEQLVIPFTTESLDLRDKEYVFAKKKDKHKHYVCIIRDITTAHFHPGINSQYDVLHENLLISGHIVRINGVMYFNYETLIATHYNNLCHINEVIIRNEKPLFNK